MKERCIRIYNYNDVFDVQKNHNFLKQVRNNKLHMQAFLRNFHHKDGGQGTLLLSKVKI